MDGLSINLVEGSPPVLRVAGEIDMATAESLAAALKEAIAADATVIIDMAGVTFVDAAGLQVILHAAASKNGLGPLTLVNAARVAWLLELVGLQALPSIDVRGGE